ncbi:hypothetical protein MSAN_00250500 [Mycena sanguinolenta]|uniref:Glycosyltransferase subfamily 4-like N-terminal domain-containing protein n=1 Tax=Mycena sanguinolenta TaxID=230812 RepID=A0A8H7DMW9_9AGAR|nr:hypothetical protein MSAN_00250500 [Mycena sanguinolenta]
MSLPLHEQPMRVAIVAENFLPKIDGSTITLSHLLQHLSSLRIPTLLLGPSSPLALTNTTSSYGGASLFGTPGVPLPSYPGLKINFLTPSFLSTLRAFRPTVIHIVDPIWLGVQALASIQLLFPDVPIVSSHHTNLPTYAQVFGYPYFTERIWGVHTWLHSFARTTLVPSNSTKSLLRERGWGNLRVVGRGVDEGVFHPSHRSPTLRASWGAQPQDVVILSVGRLSPEKNLVLLVHAYAALVASLRALSSTPGAANPEDAPDSVGADASYSSGDSDTARTEDVDTTRAHEAPVRTHLVFIGDGPFRPSLQALCASLGVRAIFTGQLTGKKLGEAVASADILSSPSITETFGQVTLQGMAAGLPIVGLYVEGTADLVRHGVRGEVRVCFIRFSSSYVAFLHLTVAFSWTPSSPPPGPHAHAAGLVEGAAWMDVSDESLHISPPLSPSANRIVIAKERGEDDDDIPVPDSAVCLSPTYGVAGRGSMSMEELVLPEAARDDPPTFCPSPTLGTPYDEEDEDPFFSPYPDSPSSGNDLGANGERMKGKETEAPRVGCFRTLAPLMRPDAPAFPAIVEAYAGLLGGLVRSPALRAAMGKRAHARSTRFRWTECSQRVVDAYVDACRPRDPSPSSTASPSSSSAPNSWFGFASASSSSKAPSLSSAGGAKAKVPETETDLEAQTHDSKRDDAHDDDAQEQEDPRSRPLLGLVRRVCARRSALSKANSSDVTALGRLITRNSSTNVLGFGRLLGSPGGVSGMTQNVAAGWTWVVDALVVGHALVAATLSHAAYMVPASEDMWGRGPRR